MNYMSHPLSVRLNDATIARLGRHAQRVHLAPRTLAQRYVEEGLRMDEHPLIRKLSDYSQFVHDIFSKEAKP